MKDSTTSGFILAKQKFFDNIANCLLQINSEVLADITEHMMKGERVKGESQNEKDCLLHACQWQKMQLRSRQL